VRTLVIHPGALGDIILSRPALQLMRERLPGAHLVLAADLDHSEAAARGAADELLSLSRLPTYRLFGSDALPVADLSFWRSFDQVVSWMGHGESTFEARLARSSNRCLVASWQPEPGSGRHVAQAFVDSLAPWLGAAKAVPDRIPVSPTDPAKAESWLRERGWSGGRGLVALHPGAGSESKRWPLERFLALAGALADRAMDLLVVAGPAEPGLAARLAQGVEGSQILIAQSLPLPLLAGLLSLCSRFAGNDSGVAHLAAGLGVPSVVLFGPTRPELWAPLGAHVTTLRDHTRCPACWGLAARNHTCMEAIPVESALGCLIG